MTDKPVALSCASPWAEILLQALLPYAKIKDVEKGQRLRLVRGDKRLCRLLVYGGIDVYRESDGLLIVSTEAPRVLGLATSDVFLIINQPSSVATLSLEEAFQHIRDQGLWHPLAEHMMLVNQKLYLHGQRISAPTTYDVVCDHLIELSTLPDSIRLNTTAERFICQRTHISRSMVMKILSDLKHGGYISITRGVLYAVNKLPAKYQPK